MLEVQCSMFNVSAGAGDSTVKLFRRISRRCAGCPGLRKDERRPRPRFRRGRRCAQGFLPATIQFRQRL